jgi:CBS domain-containing protein
MAAAAITALPVVDTTVHPAVDTMAPPAAAITALPQVDIPVAAAITVARQRVDMVDPAAADILPVAAADTRAAAVMVVVAAVIAKRLKLRNCGSCRAKFISSCRSKGGGGIQLRRPLVFSRDAGTVSKDALIQASLSDLQSSVSRNL